ncbi:dnaJ homolog subfamily C member 12 isoform X1 [Chrysemys picta bellii]|uniref:dnaJ homolog subfamily C member 12 isoform X1 n=1 Tax=Chrysemys picta bellii TaxID=8478 RepID=UPI0032B2B267
MREGGKCRRHVTLYSGLAHLVAVLPGSPLHVTYLPASHTLRPLPVQGVINKSPGPDGIHPRILKELKCEIAELLTMVCNLSFKSSSVPNDWKIVNVTPIFKRGSRGDPGNYRPVKASSVLRHKVLGRDAYFKHILLNKFLQSLRLKPLSVTLTNILETLKLWRIFRSCSRLKRFLLTKKVELVMITGDEAKLPFHSSSGRL